MRHVFWMAMLCGIACVGTTARAADYPPRKAGLWVISMTAGGAKPRAMETKLCIDAASDAALYKSGMETAGAICSQRAVTRSGSTVTSDSVCTIGETKVTSHAVIAFTDDVAYHTEINAHFDPPMMPGRSDTTSIQDAKWVGPCPADMKPGDLLMPNGMKMNMLEAQRGR